MKFNNPATEALYEAVYDNDVQVTQQGVWSGMFSNISPEFAEGMLQRGSNLLKKIETPLLKEDEAKIVTQGETPAPSAEKKSESENNLEENDPPPGA